MVPPWILKTDGLESSGQRPISLNGKTNSTLLCFFFFLRAIFSFFKNFRRTQKALAKGQSHQQELEEGRVVGRTF